MSKAPSLLALCVALTLFASACGADAEVTINSDLETSNSSFGSAGAGGGAADDATARGSDSTAAIGSTTESCSYLGTDSWDDMQLEVWFTSELPDVTNADVDYSVTDATGAIIYESRATVPLLAAGEVLRWHIDTLTEPDGSDSGYGCQVDAVTAARTSSDDLPPAASDSCQFVEVDSWGDIQIRLDFAAPSGGELLVHYALRSIDGIRFNNGTAWPPEANAGEQVTYDEDTLDDLPDWLEERDVTCEILSIEEF